MKRITSSLTGGNSFQDSSDTDEEVPTCSLLDRLLLIIMGNRRKGTTSRDLRKLFVKDRTVGASRPKPKGTVVHMAKRPPPHAIAMDLDDTYDGDYIMLPPPFGLVGDDNYRVDYKVIPPATNYMSHMANNGNIPSNNDFSRPDFLQTDNSPIMVPHNRQMHVNDCQPMNVCNSNTMNMNLARNQELLYRNNMRSEGSRKPPVRIACLPPVGCAFRYRFHPWRQCHSYAPMGPIKRPSINYPPYNYVISNQPYPISPPLTVTDNSSLAYANKTQINSAHNSPMSTVNININYGNNPSITELSISQTREDFNCDRLPIARYNNEDGAWGLNEAANLDLEAPEYNTPVEHFCINELAHKLQELMLEMTNTVSDMCEEEPIRFYS